MCSSRYYDKMFLEYFKCYLSTYKVFKYFYFQVLYTTGTEVPGE